MRRARPLGQIWRIWRIAPLLAALVMALILAQAEVKAQTLLPEPRPATSTTDAQKQMEKLNQEIRKHKQRQKELEEESRVLSEQAKKIRSNIIDLAALMRRHDTELARIQNHLQALNATERSILARLKSQRAAMAQALAGLQHMEQNPPPAFIAYPDDVLAAIRGGLLMSGLVPVIQARAKAIRAQLDELARVRKGITAQRVALVSRQSEARDDRTKLRALLNRKEQEESARRRAAQEEAERVRNLARAAQNLGELMGRLSRTTSVPAHYGAFHLAKGKLPLPVEGRMVAVEEGASAALVRPGLTIQTYGSAQVTAPYDGRVLYAGPFRQYGNILILGVGNGYHLLFAGLGAMNVFVGQDVLAGEPLGEMPPRTGGRNAVQPRLYVEIRHQGKTIAPRGWMVAGP